MDIQYYADTKPMKQTIENFYSVIKTKVDLTNQVRSLYGKTLSPDFNALDFWHVNENKVSEIFAFLINPHAPHGQGDSFLQLFIKKFELDFSYTSEDKIVVRCEHSTDDNRRIDVLISKNGNDTIIGIENKIYTTTTDQNNQVHDYLKYLDSRTKNYCLLYLAPSEKRIGEHSISVEAFETYTGNNKLKMISYEFDIIELIHSFALHCESERVRFFILEFEKKLKQMFMGEDQLDENKFITEHILKSEENLALSFNVAKNLIEVKKKLEEKFEHQLKDIGNAYGLTVDGLHLYPPKWNKYHLAFSYESGGILYGIKRKERNPEKPTLPSLQQLFAERFKTTPWWPMWEYFYPGIHYNSDFWMDIHSGTIIGKVENFLDKLKEKFESDEY